jgi:protein ImuB
MTWLALHFPALPLAPWTRSQRYRSNAGDEAPFAVLQRQRIACANAAAIARGVAPGQSTGTACALCAGLRLRERDARAERALLEHVAQWALRYTPDVCLDNASDDLLLNVAGCLQLHGGLDALRARIARELAAQGLDVRIGAAPTPRGAQLLARAGTPEACPPDAHALRQHLRRLPLPALGLEPRTETALMNMGLHTFGDIDALPRATLARRFGKAFAHWLDQVTGAAPDPRVAITPREFFVRELHFLDGISQADGLLFPMQRLLGEFAHFLRQRQLASSHLVWRITGVDGRAREIPLHLGAPAHDAARFLSLTRVHLERLRIESPVETLRLCCARFTPLAAVPDTLFPELADNRAGDWSALVDRLRARLGEANCQRLQLRDAQRPEDLQQPVAPENARAQPTPPSAARRPLWLLPEPQRLLQRDGKPCRHGAPLELLDGRERLDSHWWDTPLARDYAIARDSEQLLLWVFRDRHDGHWYLHGIFG